MKFSAKRRQQKNQLVDAKVFIRTLAKYNPDILFYNDHKNVCIVHTNLETEHLAGLNLPKSAFLEDDFSECCKNGLIHISYHSKIYTIYAKDVGIN